MTIFQKTNRQEIAFAIMVKTPGLSALKTRLAKKIGGDRALRFFLCAVHALHETIEQLRHELLLTYDIQLIPYWAIAELEGMAAPIWHTWNKEYQGEGDLGHKLHTIHSRLQKKHGAVIIIGSDLPHIDPHNLTNAVLTLCDGNKRNDAVQKNQNEEFVLGPTLDGGYYLVGSSRSLEPHVWISVPYSCAQTFDCFKANLARISPVSLLPMSYDIDELEDLKKLRSQFEARTLPNICRNVFQDFFANDFNHASTQ